MIGTDIPVPRQGSSADALEELSHKPDGIDDCRERLQQDARSIKILRRLSGRGVTLVPDALGILTKPQTGHDSRTYQLFLRDILSQAGPELVVLCAASLGKQRVARLSTHDRAELVLYAGDNKADLCSPALELLAQEYQLPAANDSRLAPVAGTPKKRVHDEEHSPRRGVGADRQEFNNERGGESEEAEFETDELPAIEDRTERATSHIQPRKRRHIEDEHAPETVQMKGLAKRDIQKRQKEIEYRCSEAPISQIWLLGERLCEAVQSSDQWKWERDLGGSTTDCLNVLVPEDRSQDISINLVVGRKKGLELIKKFNLSFF